MLSAQSSFPLKSSLFILLLSLSLFHFKLSFRLSPNLTLTPDRTQPQASRANYIVRFIDYKPASEHRSYLESSLRSEGWEWIQRNNPAAKFPTDFGLLSVRDSVKESVIEEIERLGFVKDVNVDLIYSRGILSGAFENGRKRPGKIFTSMSFSEKEKHFHHLGLSNSSLNWSRHLLMQRSQVTSLFGADALWRKGYTGAKVKMAIFDTGIRADHPHFRNIKERTNWTNEDTLNDNLGHGTFVAGVIAGEDAECLGFAPDTEIYAFRVFTDAQLIAGIIYILVP